MIEASTSGSGWSAGANAYPHWTPAGRSWSFAEGGRLGYDRLLVAVGSKAAPAPWPGSAGPGMHGFVTLRDLEGLDGKRVQGCAPRSFGGGLIGVEGGRDPDEARPRRHLHRRRRAGIFRSPSTGARRSSSPSTCAGTACDCRLGVNVEEVLRGPDGRVRGLRLSPAPGAQPPAGTRRIACDWSSPRSASCRTPTSFARAAWPSARGAPSRRIRRCETNVAAVWAAGDCANVTWAERQPSSGAALVYRSRSGEDCRRIDAGRRGRLQPRHLVQTPPSSSISSTRPRDGCP
jgi:hypothetical protein